MPRYIVERHFPNGLNIPVNAEGAAAMLGVVDRNLGSDVSWVQSFVTPDKSKTFCVYDGPNPEAIHEVAEKNGLPVDKISEVRVLNPYFYF